TRRTPSNAQTYTPTATNTPTNTPTNTRLPPTATPAGGVTKQLFFTQRYNGRIVAMPVGGSAPTTIVTSAGGSEISGMAIDQANNPPYCLPYSPTRPPPPLPP